jgi:hypothetical protein
MPAITRIAAMAWRGPPPADRGSRSKPALADPEGMTKTDNRKHPRVRIEALAALKSHGRHGCDQAFTAVTDISRSGIGLRTGQPPAVGQSATLRLALGEEIHVLNSTVTRVESRGNGVFTVGLDWTTNTSEDNAFLQQFFAAVEQHD